MPLIPGCLEFALNNQKISVSKRQWVAFKYIYFHLEVQKRQKECPIAIPPNKKIFKDSELSNAIRHLLLGPKYFLTYITLF